MLKTISTDKAPKAIGPYSQAIVADSLVFISGQIPVEPATSAMVEAKISVQAEQCMKNIATVLDAAGSSYENVIKTTCFLTDMADFAEFNAVYEKYFISKPARCCVAVKTLPKNALCEIDVIAAK
jgi:2-iminobutanoate/2-iminopropanoate deaminase